MQKVTIKDVAKAAGVSVSLVSYVMYNSRAVNNGEKKKYSVNEDTEKKILQIAEQLGYRPNRAAAGLRGRRQCTIGVILPDIANHFFSDIARYLENIAFESGYNVLFASSDESAEKMGNIVETFLDNSLDGFIIAACKGSEEAVRKVASSGIPMVLIDRDVPDVDCGKVLLDNIKAMDMAVDHLCAAGYKRIEMLNYTLGISSMSEREMGYRIAMRRHSLEENIRVSYSTYGHAEKDIFNFIADAVTRGVEAMLLPSNTISVLGLHAIHELGIRVPDQLAVICFDNNDSYDLYTPKITRITQSAKDIASGAFKQLKGLIDDPLSKAETLLLEPEFIIRDSTLPAQSTEPAFPFTCRDSVLLCASGFDNKGGWSLDTRHVSQMQSPFLIAHGEGVQLQYSYTAGRSQVGLHPIFTGSRVRVPVPVEDASTSFSVVHSGRYKLWVRCGGTGRFTLSMDGKDIENEFGGGFSDTWGWQSDSMEPWEEDESVSYRSDGGVELTTGRHTLSLHDLDGRGACCDAVLLTLNDTPPPDDCMFAMRKALLRLDDAPKYGGQYDLVVIGGGIAGVSAAITAARKGLKVALVHDRMILGGDNSTETGIGLGGRINTGAFPSLGYIMNEIGPAPDSLAVDRSSQWKRSRVTDASEDERKMRVVLSEPLITLFTGQLLQEVLNNDPETIGSIVLTDAQSYSTVSIRSSLFFDATGYDCLTGDADERPFWDQPYEEGMETGNDPTQRMVPDNHCDLPPKALVAPGWESRFPLNSRKFFDKPYEGIFSKERSNLFIVPDFKPRKFGGEYVSRSAGILGETVGLLAAACKESDVLPGDLCEKKIREQLSCGVGRTDVPYTQTYNLDVS